MGSSTRNRSKWPSRTIGSFLRGWRWIPARAQRQCAARPGRVEMGSLSDVVRWISTAAKTGGHTRSQAHGRPPAPVAPSAPRRVADRPSGAGPSRRGRHWDAPEAASRDRDAGGDPLSPYCPRCSLPLESWHGDAGAAGPPIGYACRPCGTRTRWTPADVLRQMQREVRRHYAHYWAQYQEAIRQHERGASRAGFGGHHGRGGVR
jgi:hypothetical protein